MKFSICIPNYNYAAYIGCTIQSMLDQSYPDFEVGVHDIRRQPAEVATQPKDGHGIEGPAEAPPVDRDAARAQARGQRTVRPPVEDADPRRDADLDEAGASSLRTRSAPPASR